MSIPVSLSLDTEWIPSVPYQIALSISVGGTYTNLGATVYFDDGTPTEYHPGGSQTVYHTYTSASLPNSSSDEWSISVTVTGKTTGGSTDSGYTTILLRYVNIGDYTVNWNPDTDTAFAQTILCLGLAVDASATWSCEGNVPPIEVTFTSVVTGGTPPYTYLWDFGDGQTSDEANPVHTYQGLGPYVVTLTVTDSVGAQASTTLNQEIGCGQNLTTKNLMFIDCPTYSREQLMEYPIANREKEYLSENAQGPLIENPIFVISGRHNTLLPFLEMAPIFSDQWFVDGALKRNLYIWGFPLKDDPTVFVLNVAARGKTGTTLNYLTKDGSDGGLVLRVLGSGNPEICGFKSAAYPDKLGFGLTDPDGSSGGDVNGTYLRIKSGTYTSGRNNHILAKNPFSTGQPPDEKFPNESSGTDTRSQKIQSWTDDTDKLKWVDARTVSFGFPTATDARGIRFYISGVSYDTLMELEVRDYGGKDRFLGTWVGPYRVLFFGLPGDKIRWFLSHRCGEPLPYIPAYNIPADVLLPAQPDPRTCVNPELVSDEPPTVTITEGPGGTGGGGGGGGGGSTLLVNIDSFDRDCLEHLALYTCDVTIHGGVPPLTITVTVVVNTGYTVNKTVVSQVTDTSISVFFEPPQYAGGGAFQIICSVEDSIGARGSTQIGMTLQAIDCSGTP